jgi:hypothetical protein
MEVHLMTDMMSSVENAEDSKPETGLDGLDEQLLAQLVSRAWAGGLALTGEGGVLAQLTKRLLESALEGEITDHLGYDKHDPTGRGTGNSRRREPPRLRLPLGRSTAWRPAGAPSMPAVEYLRTVITATAGSRTGAPTTPG